MKLRKSILAGLLGLTVLAGCGAAGVWAVTGGLYGCTSRDQELADGLRTLPVLDARRPDARQLDRRYSGCDEDDGFAYAGQHYEHGGTPAELLAFYRAEASGDGWQPAPDGHAGQLCFTKPYGTVTAHLKVWVPGTFDSAGEPPANPGEYGLEVTASHDGSAWC
ncbi:hypothetical protein [Kitasatospora sp. NPDC002040]|uniref:hypothetical protein n=1 Tax=Kitasatospora sp. NPDC002040 TaxID=3154661 RepID=UPI00332931B8